MIGIDSLGVRDLEHTEGHVVIGADNCLRLRISGQRRLEDRNGLRTSELGGLADDNLDLVLTGEDLVESLMAVDGRGRTGLTLQLDDVAAVRQDLDQIAALEPATLDIVRADMGQRVDIRDVAVDRNDDHAGIDRGLHRRGQRGDVVRADHRARSLSGR